MNECDKAGGGLQSESSMELSLASFTLTSAGVRNRLLSSCLLVFRLCFLLSGWKSSWWLSFCLDFSGKFEIFTVFVCVTSSSGTHWSGSLKHTDSQTQVSPPDTKGGIFANKMNIHFFSFRGQSTAKICLYCSDVEVQICHFPQLRGKQSFLI